MTSPDANFFLFPYLPVLPYNQPEPSSGSSGSDTSAARAKSRDSSGKTARTQSKILTLLSSTTSRGLTVAEARYAVSGSHHGTLSGSLSNLHKAGKIARLAEVRDGCKVYVLPAFVNGRETESQGHK